jgi:hypothetical protein
METVPPTKVVAIQRTGKPRLITRNTAGLRNSEEGTKSCGRRSDLDYSSRGRLESQGLETGLIGERSVGTWTQEVTIGYEEDEETY